MRVIIAAAASLALIAAAAPPPAAPAAPLGILDGNGRPIVDPAHQAKNDFAAILLATRDLDALFAEWAKPETPHIDTTREIVRGERVFGALVLAGCRAAADGNCNVTVTFSMVAPGGAPYGEEHKAIAWSHPPAPGRNFLLSEASLGFSLDPPDRLGRYLLRAQVKDEVAGTELRLEQKIEAVAAHRPRAARRSI
jgi:hypothetical protein